MPNYLLVGDLHSQVRPLHAVFEYCSQHNRVPIFLGDVFDSRTDTSDTIEVYNLLKVAPSFFPGMRILRSNHQDKFERLAKGNPVRPCPELNRTVAEFEAAGISLKEVHNWLVTFPYGVCFRDSRGKEYRCAHAYFPNRLQVPEYEGLHDVMSVNSSNRYQMLFGPLHRETGARLNWWEIHDRQDWVRVAGHYHVIHQSEKALVLDGGCGSDKRSWFCGEEATLVAYDIENETVLDFGSGCRAAQSVA